MKPLQLMVVLFVACSWTAVAQIPAWRQMNSALTTFAQQPGHPDVVFAGDAAGLIRRSGDRGATWKLVSAESPAAITSLAFLDASRGFAGTTQSGLILMTTDGGMTWKPKQFVDAQRPNEVYRFHPVARVVAVDEQTAFFDIYNHPISAPSARETIVTRDGGTTFAIDSVPGEVYHVAGGIMIALGREVGAFGLAKFTVYKSTDKGVSWEIVKTSPDGLNNDFNNHGINLAVFLNDEEFFITANKNLSGDKAIYKTTDGGLTFTPMANTPKAKIDYLHFKNASQGFAITGNAGGYTTFTTNDGGATWTPAERNVQWTGHYLGNDTFIAYIDDHTAISTDFGVTWTEQADPINTVRGSMGTPSLHVLQIVNDTVAFASVGKLSSGVYSGRELMRTTDGGLTWHMLRNAAGEPFRGEAYHFVSRDTFFFFGTGYNNDGTSGGYMKIRYTTDGGLTAADVHTGGYREEVLELLFSDDRNAVTYSSNSSKINYSTNGGKSWSSVLFPSQYGQLRSMEVPGINAWFAMTDSKLLRSTDQGANWTELATNGIKSCGSMAMHFLSPSVGFIHGCMNAVAKTTDGGETWSDLSAGMASELNGRYYTVMAFQNGSTGYMADPSANNRSIATTTDGGASWSWFRSSQLGAWIAKIDFADENTGMMMDVHGNILRLLGPVASTDTLALGTGVVGVEEPTAVRTVALSPNPAGDAVRIAIQGERVRAIEVSDLTGRVQMRLAVQPGRTVYTVDTAQLPAGVYMVTVHTADGVLSQHLRIVH